MDSPATCSTKKSMKEKACDMAKKLCKYQLKADYTLNLDVYEDEHEENAKCSHSMQGTTKHSIVKIVAVVSAVALVVCAVSSVCSLISKD